jgi:hypothetical protein
MSLSYCLREKKRKIKNEVVGVYESKKGWIIEKLL